MEFFEFEERTDVKGREYYFMRLNIEGGVGMAVPTSVTLLPTKKGFRCFTWWSRKLVDLTDEGVVAKVMRFQTKSYIHNNQFATWQESQEPRGIHFKVVMLAVMLARKNSEKVIKWYLDEEFESSVRHVKRDDFTYEPWNKGMRKPVIVEEDPIEAELRKLEYKFHWVLDMINFGYDQDEILDMWFKNEEGEDI